MLISVSQSSSIVSSSSSNRRNKMPENVRAQVVARSNIQRVFQPFDINNIYNIIEPNSLPKCQLCQYNYQLQSLKHLCNCEHVFCQNCLNQYIIYKINVSEEIICPAEECRQPLNKQSDVFTCLHQSQLDRYRKQELWRQTMKNPNTKVCPIEDCSEGVINLLQENPQCNSCGTKFCPQCLMTQHKGSCERNFQNQFREWRRCPNCKLFINKDGGCNHMICQCSEQFCFVCLEPWQEYHYQCIDIYEMRGPFGECIAKSPFIMMICAMVMFPLVISLLLAGGIIAVAGVIVVGTVLVPITLLKQSKSLILGIIAFPVLMCLGGIGLAFYFLGTVYFPSVYRVLTIYIGLIRSLWHASF